jgi:hypothetical protein
MLKKVADLKIGDEIIVKGYGGLEWNTLNGKIVKIVDSGKWLTAFVDDGNAFQLPSGTVIYKDVALSKGDSIEVA